MKLDIKKGNVRLTYIQCENWSSGNLVSDGFSLEINQEGPISLYTFYVDLSINEKTANKQSSNYTDWLSFKENSQNFQYLTIGDESIVKMLAGRVKHFQNKDKAKTSLELKVDAEGTVKRFSVYPSVSNELKLTQV